MSDPKDIFKKFGPSARHILVAGQKIAQNMRSGIGSEHILMAMTTAAGTLAYDILKENAINIDQIKLVLSLNNIQTNINQGLSQELKKLLIIAAKKATELNSPIIESEHLLWAILSDNNNKANQAINRIGIDVSDLKQQVEEVFDDLLYEDPLSTPGQIPKNFGLFNMDPYSMPPGFNLINPDLMNQTKTNGKKSKTPFLDQFGIDLTKLAKDDKLDPVIGRNTEISRAIQILARRNKNNPVLVGEPGIGKTAIVEGLAQRINSNLVPEILKGKKIINLDLSSVVAGTMYRGQFEDRIKKILNEIILSKNIILFIDELHTIIGAGSAEGSMDAANILKPSLAKGQIRLIGATTSEEYRKHIEKDAALERRLQVIKVQEPSVEETIAILKGVKSKYQDHHQVTITDNAIVSASKLAKRYIADRYLPDKAIDLIDEAAAAKQILREANPELDKISELKNSLNKIILDKESAAENQNYELAAQLKIDELKIIDQINKFKKTFNYQSDIEVNEIDIAQIVSMWTSIPLDNLIQTEQKKLINLESILNKKIIGQEEAVQTISSAIRRTKSGIGDPNRPIGAFIFLGPTGVGKTELAKVLASEVFNNENALIKIDMSEFSEKHNVARLVGSPPGYVGYDDAGKLTESVRKQPYSVILLDEIEKAHPEVFNILLQIIEDGYLTDAKGKKVNFRNTIIILTSNIGLQELTRQAAIGFKSHESNQLKIANNKYEEMKKTVLEQLKKQFRPELLNRLDKIIVFKPLYEPSIKKIIDLQLKQLTNRIKNQGITLDINDNSKKFLAQHGYDPEFGARPVRRIISEMVENPLSDMILSGQLNKNDKVFAKLVGNKIIFSNR
ncbi:MAG: hypothetical protein ACD_58C00143G0002 [uncultured bacterium]|nr:MAG: hypothetical protein ACD_58C00143G0002 [uncultured bacterium]